MVTATLGRLVALAGTLCLLGAAPGAPSLAPSLPRQIDVGEFGQPSFAEDFRTLDWGTDQIRPEKPHRWRTVHGYGGPDADGNRALSRTTLAVDPNFAGRGGKAPLGIQPFSIGPDGLTITARRADPGLKDALFGRTWTSGLLTTKFSFAQLHGYFEAEMDLPVCEKGAWPAFWMLPRTLGWPLHGEIDAPEAIGDGELYWSTHTKAPGQKGFQATSTPGCARGWHRYGVLWREDRIGFYYDRRLVAETQTPADYTEPMFLLLNLAVGGSWPGEPEEEATEMTMRVREVRAWRIDG